MSIRVIDVGEHGAQIDAYDGIGNLLASDTAFGSGVGDDLFFDLLVTDSAIWRIELYQPKQFLDIGDGLLWEDLSFSTAVPIPVAVWLFGSGLLGLGGIARHKKTA